MPRKPTARKITDAEALRIQVWAKRVKDEANTFGDMIDPHWVRNTEIVKLLDRIGGNARELDIWIETGAR